MVGAVGAVVAVGVGVVGVVGLCGFRPGMVVGPDVVELPPGPVEPAVEPGALPVPLPLPLPMPLPTAGPSELVDENDDVGLIEGEDVPELPGPDKDDALDSVPVWDPVSGPFALGAPPVGEPL
ncbi:MAG: hypothetical protein HQL38_08345 [Alphaproteobacteria bacterium]|nr:hypothetical protein [Alphaproteobacteria bacterium]